MKGLSFGKVPFFMWEYVRKRISKYLIDGYSDMSALDMQNV